MTQEAIALRTSGDSYPGIAVVQDVNKALATIATDFAGPDDPAALAGPYMTWADTGNMRRRIRNAANSAWLDIGPLLGSDTLNAFDALVGENGKFPVFTSAGEMAVRDILGTVSQSGGVPTGALIEYGSNSNGAYQKFAGGLQICTALIPFSAFAGSHPFSWTFPASFSTIRYADVRSVAPNSASRKTELESSSGTSVSGYVHNTGSDVLVSLLMVAIGQKN